MKIINNCSYLSVTNVIWLERQKHHRALPNHNVVESWGWILIFKMVRGICIIPATRSWWAVYPEWGVCGWLHNFLLRFNGQSTRLAKGHGKCEGKSCWHTCGTRGSVRQMDGDVAWDGLPCAAIASGPTGSSSRSVRGCLLPPRHPGTMKAHGHSLCTCEKGNPSFSKENKPGVHRWAFHVNR